MSKAPVYSVQRIFVRSLTPWIKRESGIPFVCAATA
jgi:hypothetical protein